MEIKKSSEDYLETILILKEEKGYARSIDVASHLGVTKPSVSYAVKRLRENGYLTMDDEGLLNLTDAGMGIASGTYEKHKILTEFLVNIGVDRETAMHDACEIEHDISRESFDAIRKHIAELGKNEGVK